MGGIAFTYKFVKSYFKDNGCELLSKEYKNSHEYLKYKCSCGEISKIKFYSFKAGHRCSSCGLKKISDKTRFSYKYIKKYFKDNDCKLLAKEYKGSHIPMKYKCSCGNISTIAFSMFKLGQRCKKCGNKRSGGERKFSYTYVKNYFKDNDCELLSKEYKNCGTKMEYICSCGNISRICFSDFKSGHRCVICGHKKKADKKRFTYEYVKEYFKDNDCELLSKEYINANVNLKYKCSCGNIGKISFRNFKTGQRCYECGIKKLSNKKRLSYEYVKEYFKDKGCKLLSKEYKRADINLRYRCSCGNISKIRFSSFKNGHRCKSCAIKRMVDKKRFSYKYVKEYFKDNDCELLSKEYKHSGFKLKYKCSCGNVSTIAFSMFKQGHRCKECGFKKLRGSLSAVWNPTYSEEDRKRMTISRYIVPPGYGGWRQKVLKRDNYSCVCCGSTIKLCVHHIVGYLDNIDLATTVSNGATLCEDCHIWFHIYYGKIGINKLMLKEFIYNSNCGSSKAVRNSFNL